MIHRHVDIGTHARKAEADEADEEDLSPWVRVESHKLRGRRLPTVGTLASDLVLDFLLDTHFGCLASGRIDFDLVSVCMRVALANNRGILDLGTRSYNT